ncbi:hypothetical protein L7F22_035309 [Adiantum nelumboides]|nr:hypothetical protein [Adiantum nelumboides]
MASTGPSLYKPYFQPLELVSTLDMQLLKHDLQWRASTQALQAIPPTLGARQYPGNLSVQARPGLTPTSYNPHAGLLQHIEDTDRHSERQRDRACCSCYRSR